MALIVEAYNEKDGCGFCHSTEFTRLTAAVDSNVKCDHCGAIFLNLLNRDKQKAGKFTGRYAEISKEDKYKFGFGRGFEKKEETKSKE